MDSIIRAVAEKRYESDMECAHKILHDHFEKQPDVFYDSKKREKWWELKLIKIKGWKLKNVNLNLKNLFF